MITLRSSRLRDTDASPRRAPRPLVLSVALHIVVAFVLAQFLISPWAFTTIFGGLKSPSVPVERVGFLRLPKSGGPPVDGKSGGDNRPLSSKPATRVVAPTDVPTSIPAQPATPRAAETEGGSGPLVGGGGPTKGIRPNYTDPRVWAAPGDIVTAPKNAKEKLNSVVASIIQPFNDSMAVVAGQRKPGDWTFEKDGRKYGIDEKFIRLGKVSIPTALLALLPINTTGNPTMNDRNRMQNRLHSDIFWQAQRGMNEADFKKAVKSIRERKERERAAAQKTRQANEPAAQSPPDKN